MKKVMRIMSPKPLNAETPITSLRSWITPNSVFFNRNQGIIPSRKPSLSSWNLVVDGEVESPRRWKFAQLCGLPKAIVANTLECSGNGRSLFREKAGGNPWTIGGVGNAVWAGIWLREVLSASGLKPGARHVAFEGFDKPSGSAQIQFIRSIPIEKAMDSTLLAYEMNGEQLPLRHGFPLRALALGWTGTNSTKWLKRITVLTDPQKGFYMDQVYRVFQKGQKPDSGAVVTGLNLKAIITHPLSGEEVAAGLIPILGAAYAGEAAVEWVEISWDNGASWTTAEFIGPHEPFAWRQWQLFLDARHQGPLTVLARATAANGERQPMNAAWNALGYGNNGVHEHAVTFNIL